MTELETATRQAKELEDRVKHLYLQAAQCDSGLVALKLIYPDIKLPTKTISKYRGELAVAIIEAVMKSFGFWCEWKVWLKSKKKYGKGFHFKITMLNGFPVPTNGTLPWDFSHKHYFVYSFPGDLPFN